MLTVTRRFRWEMAHRLGEGYEGKCKNLHGHSYVLEATFACRELNSHGMVLDFTDIKKIVKNWVDAHLDHAVMVQASDWELAEFLTRTQQRMYLVPFDPTVENLILHLSNQFTYVLEGYLISEEDRGVKLVRLKLYETVDAWAEWEENHAI